MGDPFDPYAELGLNEDASLADIQAAFRRLAKQHHPDLFRSYMAKARATVRMQRINRAYSLLKDRSQHHSQAPRRTREQVDAEQTVAGDVVLAAARRHQSARPVSRGLGVALTLLWLSASAAYSYWQWPSGDGATIWAGTLLFIYALIVTPMVLGVLALALSFPVFLIVKAFREGAESTKPTKTKSTLRVVADTAIRFVGAAACAGAIVKLYQWDIQSDLLYMFLLYVAAFMSGEVMAALWYLIAGRRVASKTTDLVRSTG